MCTVTIVPTTRGWRMACNRDELHTRPAALGPQLQSIDEHDVIMPIDPVAEGTWISVNEAGLAMTLLNHNLPDPPAHRPSSRGLIIPRLASAPTIQEAVARMSRIDPTQFMPFRLLITDGVHYAMWQSDQPCDSVQIQQLNDKPLMYTSSGLGDHLVQPPRRGLFDAWFGDDSREYAQRQIDFHQHQWPDQPQLSVCMSREEACTVSHTLIAVEGHVIEMTYHPTRPDRDAEDMKESLLRRVTAS